MKYSKTFLFATGCIILTVVLSGCDLVSTITDYFTSDKKEETAAPAEAVPRETKEAALGVNELARVGSWRITIDEFNERLQALKEVAPDFDVEDVNSKALVLEELVRQQLLVQEATQTGVSNEKDIVDAVNEFRQTVIVREMARRITENIAVTDEDAQKFYEENKQTLIEPAEYHVRQIVVNTKESADSILVEILGGLDFAQAARQYSVNETAQNGGDLGFIGDVPFPKMANALLSLEAGGVSSVFSGPDGFYIIKLEEKRGGEQIPFEEIKEDIVRNQLLLKQQQAVLDYIKNLQQTFTVEINEELLQ